MTKEIMIIETVSGQLVDLHNFAPYEILLPDVVHGLSLVNRFNGRYVRDNRLPGIFDNGPMVGRSLPRDKPVTVLQHSYAMYLFARQKHRDNPRVAIECLLHDAPEAYTGDIISPLKAHIPMLHEIEQRIFNALSAVYGLPLPDSEAVKELDALALRVEWETFVAQSMSLDDYKRNAAYYGERADDADPMDDVAMRRALFEARSHTPEQLADKVLLILHTEIVSDARNKFKKQHQSDSTGSILAEMKEYSARLQAKQQAGKLDQDDTSGESLVSCDIYIDGELHKHMELESVENVASEINNLYVLKPLEDGAVAVGGDDAVLARISHKLTLGGLYLGYRTGGGSCHMQIVHCRYGALLVLDDKMPHPGGKPVSPALVSHLAELAPGECFIADPESYGLTDTANLTRFACKVMMEARVKHGDGVYSSRVQMDGKKYIIIFYKETATPS